MKKEILGIHGRGTDVNSMFRTKMKRDFSKYKIEMFLPQFPRSFDPTYYEWEEVFKTIDFSKYDTIFTNSLGGIMTIRYLYENNIQVNNLVLTVPGLSFSTMRGEKPNVSEIFETLQNKDISMLSKKPIVISALDDEVVPFSSGQDLSNRLNAKFILLNDGKHKLEEKNEFIANIISKL